MFITEMEYAMKTENKFSYLQKKERQSVVGIVIDALTNAMINKELKPGDKIPTEVELSEQLGVARNSVREAIKMLVFLGVLEIRRPEGTFVCNGFSESMINPMIYGIILNQNQSGDALMELREMIEAGVMQLVMAKATTEEISALLQPLSELKEHCLSEKKDVEAAFEADNRFHDAIMEIGNNLMVSKINSIVRTLTYSTRYETVSGMILNGRGEELYLAHLRIYEMLRDKETVDLNNAIRKTYFL